MRKNVFLLLFLLISTFVSAQKKDEQQYALTAKTNTFGFSILALTDPYLSPLAYDGVGLGYTYENRRFLSPRNASVSMQNGFRIMGGYGLNPANSASMTYLGMTYNWGLCYHFRPIKGLQLLAGGTWDMELGYKMVARNVNNPINMDLATNFNLSGVAMFDIPTRKRILQVQLAVQSPILGCMFVPKAGASYYEMFELKDLAGTTHFSSVHNKRGLNGALTIDVPFNRSTWRFGISCHTLKYSANDMVFKRNEFGLMVGKTFDVASFAGRKNKAPRNFISIKE